MSGRAWKSVGGGSGRWRGSRVPLLRPTKTSMHMQD